MAGEHQIEKLANQLIKGNSSEVAMQTQAQPGEALARAKQGDQAAFADLVRETMGAGEKQWT